MGQPGSHPLSEALAIPVVDLRTVLPEQEGELVEALRRAV